MCLKLIQLNCPKGLNKLLHLVNLVESGMHLFKWWRVFHVFISFAFSLHIFTLHCFGFFNGEFYVSPFFYVLQIFSPSFALRTLGLCVLLDFLRIFSFYVQIETLTGQFYFLMWYKRFNFFSVVPMYHVLKS